MKRWVVRGAWVAIVATSGITVAPTAAQAPAEGWWRHVSALADDSMRGRETGSVEHRKAAGYVTDLFRRAGLRPGGTQGYIQTVRFRTRRVVEERSSLALVRAGGAIEPIVLGDEATLGMRIDPAPYTEAPLVFIGFGLTVPELNYDDLDGIDVRGKVVVMLSGGPPTIPGPLLAHYQSVRWEALRRAGAVGTIGIPNPRGQDIPWARSMLSRFAPSMTLADSTLDETAGQRLVVTFNPERAEKLFAGSGHTFAEMLSLANADQRLPRFPLAASIRATVATETADVESQNVVGILPGTDPVLRNEYVVISAHLDHVGVGRPINGDSIYNGAMDNASGTATLLETALTLARTRTRFRRSIIFLSCTAEEKGLLGSRYYAARPTVPAAAIVADVNVDMFLPLFPLSGLIVNGLEESDLTGDVHAAAEPLGIRVLSDPEPLRNAFTRSDQYSFIRRGIPSISLKNGFDAGSPEHQIVQRFRTERYHAPADDLAQPVDLQAAADFNRVYLAVLEQVANRPTRPAWNADSFFRRFAPAPAATP
jgi:hypothetical protein